MSAHTPGPWVVGNQTPLNFGVQRGHGMEHLGFVYGPSFPEHSEVGRRSLANARLIAAAPELLDALQALVSATERVSVGDYSEETHDMAVSKARAAIAKATGGAT